MTAPRLWMLAAVALVGCHIVAGLDDRAKGSTAISTQVSASSVGGGVGTGGGGGGTGGGGGGTGGDGSGGAQATGRLRFVHVSPDASTIDFCLDAGDGFGEPVLKGLGNTAGLPYGGVTDYLEIPAVTYDIRIVAPDAADCSTALAGLADTTGVVLPEDVDATIAATGMVTPPANTAGFELRAFVDDNTDLAADLIRVRFVHTSPDTPAVDVGLGSGAMFTPVWTNVGFPSVGQVGGNDYLQTMPLAGATISVRATGSSADALVFNNVSAPGGAVLTAFALGNLGGAPQALQVLLCVDNAAMNSCNLLL